MVANYKLCMSKSILITGSEGQLGKSIYNALHDKFKVLPTSRSLSNNLDSNYLDITDKDNVQKILSKFKPDILINCAAFTNVDKSETNKSLAHMINVKGMKNIIDCSLSSTHIIQISTDYVFDGCNSPYKENDMTYPINYYGKSKLEAENVLRGSRKKWTILRPNVLFGCDLTSNANFLGWIYKSLNDNNPITVVDDQISNPTFINDMVNAIFQTIIMSYEGILHIGSDNYLSRFEFARQFADIFNFNLKLINPISTKELSLINKKYKAKRPLNSSLSIEKVEQELNINMHSTKFSLERIKQFIN